MHQTLVYFVAILFLASTLQAQEADTFHLERLESVRKLVRAAQPDQAFNLLDQYIEEEKKEDPISHLYKYLLLKGDVYFFFSNSDSAKHYITMALDKMTVVDDYFKLDKAKAYNTLGNISSKAGDYDLAMSNYDNLFEILKNEKDSLPNLIKVRAYANMGTLAFNMGKYEESKVFGEKALLLNKEVSKGISNGTDGSIMINLAGTYSKLGQIDKALDYNQNALSILLKIIAPDNPFIGNIYQKISECYRSMGEYSESEHYLKKAQDIHLAKLGRDSEEYLATLLTQADLAISSSKSNVALALFDEYISISNDVYGLASVQSLRALLKKIDLLIKQGNCTEVEQSLSLAKPIVLEKFKENLEFEGRLYVLMARYEVACASVQAGIIAIEKASELFSSDSSSFKTNLLYASIFHAETVADQDPIEAIKIIEKNQAVIGDDKQKYFDASTRLTEMRSQCFLDQGKVDLAKDVIKEGLSFLLNTGQPHSVKELNLIRLDKQIFEHQYLESKNKSFLDSIISSSTLFLDKAKDVYSSLSTAKDKVSHNQMVNSTIQEQMRYLTLRNNKVDNEHLFLLTERQKNNFLLEQFRGTTANGEGLIDEANFNLERQLRRDIIANSTEMKELQSEAADSTNLVKISELAGIVNRLRIQQDSLQDALRAQSPQYYNYKYQQEGTNLATIQKTLGQNESLVEYYYDSTQAFAFVISRESFQAVPLEHIGIDNDIKLFRKGIKDYFDTRASGQSLSDLFSDYTQASSGLYQTLIQPLSSFLKKKLIIIPDKDLYALPFEALLLSHVLDDSKDLKTLDYLIKNYDISYANSSAEFVTSRARSGEHRYEKFLAFAPSFSKDSGGQEVALRAELFPLKFNVDEVNAIQSLFDGEVYIGADATKEKFLETYSDFDVLHFSTHALADLDNQNNSFLAFYSDTDSLDRDSHLTCSEIYGLDLPGAMVVLSACETGLGKVNPGEDLLTLSRAFNYAGVSSTITSLWRVNDAKTKDLFVNFYESFKENTNASASLREAKLKMIENGEHPYFWSGFILNGSEAKSTQFKLKWWMGLIAVLGFVGLFLFFRKKKEVG